MKAIICVGISGSGKSTYAEKLVDLGGWAEINRDNIRFQTFTDNVRDWDLYKFTKAKENKVTEIENSRIDFWISQGSNIVISNTNLNPKYREPLIQKLKSQGYDVQIKEFPITLEEAWKRDSRRENGVGKQVIYHQYQLWLDYIGRKRYTPDISKPKTIICDIDGTIADMKGIRGPFEWKRVGEDRPRNFILEMIENYYFEQEYEIVFLSGRSSFCESETREWLNKNFSGTLYSLYMRWENDDRKDAIVKEELFWQYVAPDHNVVAVIDDRPCMIRLWYELGISNVISVANPWKEF